MGKVPSVKLTFDTSDDDITNDFYLPCLRWATSYDRGVGYFTSGWLRENARGMGDFASRGGKARWLTSPHLEPEDLEFFLRIGESDQADEARSNRLDRILTRSVEEIRESLEADTLNTLAWMMFDGIIEFRFAVPTASLAGGDFHDKFGVFSDDNGNKLSFNGSQNDSKKGTINYESIKVFPSWEGLESFTEYDQKRFRRLWDNHDRNIRVHPLPAAVADGILRLRSQDRPYSTKWEVPYDRWRHQAQAREAFLRVGHGILEMATGTGKTRTALDIARCLYSKQAIDRLVVTVHGTDLLDQWCREVLTNTDFMVFRHFERHKQLDSFLFANSGAALVISRTAEALNALAHYLKPDQYDRTLFICDEVHGLGSISLANSLATKLQPFGYRLGLSATPEREYDEEGNRFIQTEIGDVVFTFSLEDAIRRGILCEFDYFPLSFSLTDEDRQEMKRLIAAHSVLKKQGYSPDDTELYRRLANVRKVSVAKIPVFKEFLCRMSEVLHRSIIFVATKEFGRLVQAEVIKHQPSFHTYFGEDDRENLGRFSKGELDCLITSHRISEGIDIRNVNNIILFSADRAKLETIQRIGRSLRTNPEAPNKRARVVDFVESPEHISDDTADEERARWLTQLAAVRREER